MKAFANLEEFAGAVGEEFGPTEWIEVSQERIDTFAEATGDHQWIHTDPVAAADGPFGGTIAHGFLTLSLLPVLWHDLYEVQNVTMAVNYGLGKVRFITPVPAGGRVRARAAIVDVQQLDGAAQGTLSTTIEVEGSDKPAAVVESIVRYVA